MYYRLFVQNRGPFLTLEEGPATWSTVTSVSDGGRDICPKRHYSENEYLVSFVQKILSST